MYLPLKTWSRHLKFKNVILVILSAKNTWITRSFFFSTRTRFAIFIVLFQGSWFDITCRRFLFFLFWSCSSNFTTWDREKMLDTIFPDIYLIKKSDWNSYSVTERIISINCYYAMLHRKPYCSIKTIFWHHLYRVFQ